MSQKRRLWGENEWQVCVAPFEDQLKTHEINPKPPEPKKEQTTSVWFGPVFGHTQNTKTLSR